jgi:ParB family chromosome partitioning protein
LGGLLGTSGKITNSVGDPNRGRYREALPLDSITEVSPTQTRRPFDPENNEDDRTFVETIRAEGIRQPISVKELPRSQGSAEPPAYRLVFGNRRVAAALAAGRMTAPAIVLPESFDDQDAEQLTIVENLHRKDLSPLEMARAVQTFMRRYGHKPSDVAKALHIPASTVSRYMKLLTEVTDPEVVARLEQGVISVNTAHQLMTLPVDDRAALLERLATDPNEAADQLQMLSETTSPLTRGSKTRKAGKPQASGAGNAADAPAWQLMLTKDERAEFNRGPARNPVFKNMPEQQRPIFVAFWLANDHDFEKAHQALDSLFKNQRTKIEKALALVLRLYRQIRDNHRVSRSSVDATFRVFHAALDGLERNLAEEI